MVPATIEAVCSRDNIYIYIYIYYISLLNQHDVLFLIFNLNPFYVLAGKAMNVCEIC